MSLFKRRKVEQILDLTELDFEVEPDPQPEADPNTPGPCPACGGLGYLDHVDLVTRSQLIHCRQCQHQWRMSIVEDERPSFYEMEVAGIQIPGI